MFIVADLVSLRHKAIVYIPYADTFNLIFAVKR